MYYEGDIIKEVEMGGARSTYGETIYSSIILPSRRRGENNTRIDRREIGWEGVVWIHLGQVRDRWQAVMNIVMNLRVAQVAGNLLYS
jgi:hypothetical protein